MNRRFHPSAERNFNRKIWALIDGVKRWSEAGSNGPMEKFPSKIEPDLMVTQENNAGPIIRTKCDLDGEPQATYFSVQEESYAIEGHARQALSGISRQIAKTTPLSGCVSYEYIEEKIIEWIISTINGDNRSDPLGQLMRNAERDIEPLTVLVPIKDLEIETEFDMGKARVVCLEEERYSRWVDVIRKAGSLSEEDAQLRMKELIGAYRGLAACEIDIEGERGYAAEIGFLTAERVSDILAIFSDAAVIPNQKTIARPAEMDAIRYSRAYLETSAGMLGLNVRARDQVLVPWCQISRSDLERFRAWGLEDISKLLTKERFTEMDRAFLNFCSIYSQASYTDNPQKKVIYCLSALESILLKNSNEAIQQNLCERMALLINASLSERKKAMKTIKEAYSIRSKLLHHGKRSKETQVVRNFLPIVRKVFTSIVLNVSRFKQKVDFLNAVDDWKLTP